MSKSSYSSLLIKDIQFDKNNKEINIFFHNERCYKEFKELVKYHTGSKRFTKKCAYQFMKNILLNFIREFENANK